MIPYALPGENVKMLVSKSLKGNDVGRGSVITRKHKCHVCHDFEASLKIIGLPKNNPILSAGFSCVVHLHTAIEEITIRKIRGEHLSNFTYPD